MKTTILISLLLSVAAVPGGAQAEPVQPTPTTQAASTATPAPVIPDNVDLLHDVVIGTGGGRPLHAEVARPKNAPAQPMPAVIMIHGGGWSSGSHKDSKMYLFLAAHGYFAACVEYRLSGEAKWPAQIEDCKLAVRWLRANAAKYHVDPNRIAALGGSAGGHLASCLGVTENESQFEGDGGYSGVSSRVQAVVDTNGPANLTHDMPKLFGATFAGKPEVYKAASPLSYVRPGLPPFLILHGDQDNTVPMEQSATFAEALKKAGVTVKFVVLKGAGHDITAVPANKELLWNESLSWLNEQMK